MMNSILLIDDKVEFKESFKILAQREGYRLAYGSCYEDLEKKLPVLYKKITVVILDIKCLITKDQEIEREDFITKALTLLNVKYPELPKLVLTGDDKAFDFSKFYGEQIYRKDPEGLKNLFVKIAELQLNHSERIKTTLEKELDIILREEEGKTLEFKSSVQFCTKENKQNKDLKFEIAKTIAAFSNTNGGRLLIGVDDNKEIIGLEKTDFSLFDKEKSEKDQFKLLLDALIDVYFSKDLHININEIEFYESGDKTVCCITIKNRHNVPVFLRKGTEELFFIRAQASSRKLNKEEIEKYLKNW